MDNSTVLDPAVSIRNIGRSFLLNNGGKQYNYCIQNKMSVLNLFISNQPNRKQHFKTRIHFPIHSFLIHSNASLHLYCSIYGISFV